MWAAQRICDKNHGVIIGESQEFQGGEKCRDASSGIKRLNEHHAETQIAQKAWKAIPQWALNISGIFLNRLALIIEAYKVSPEKQNPKPGYS